MSLIVVWTDYLKYRAELRGYDLEMLEQIVRFSPENYFDVATNRYVAVGRHREVLVMIPFERQGEIITPVTVHPTSRQQIEFRIRSGRFQP